MFKRLILLLTVAAMLAVMLVITAAPVFAAPPVQADKGLGKAFVKSGGKSHPPSDDCGPACQPF